MGNFTWLYVGGVYAIAAWVLRRMLPVRVAVLFFALVFAFLFRPLTQDVVIVPADVIRLTPPWSEVRAPGRPPVTKYEVSNLNLHDVPMQIVPWLHQVRESWRTGEVPLWNAAAGCGYPLLANGQSTPLSPLQLLTLPLPLGYAITAEAALKLLLALVLAYLFCATRYSKTASVVAAIAYGFSTWMTTWLQFPIAAAAAFLPGVLLVIDRLVDGFTRPRFVAASLMFAATVLSGHPETVFHVGLIAAAYGLWIARPLRALGRIVAACIVAALLASPFLVPFAEAVVRSQRFAEVHERAAGEPPYSDLHSAILLLQPRFFGELPIERPWGPTTLESICGFAGVLSLVAVIAAAIYIVLRRRWRDRETLYVLGAVLCFGIVLGWPVITGAFHAIAGLAPAMRMRLGICWFGSVLIAAVIDWSRRDTRIPLLIGTASVAATMLWLMRTVDFPTQSHRASALLSLLPSIAVLAALLVPRVRFHVAAVLTFVELWLAMAHWNPVLPLREWYPRTTVIARLGQLDRGARMVGIGGQLYPNTGAMFGFEDVRVHDPMACGRYVEFLTQTVGWNPKDYYAKWNDAETPLLDYLNVKYLVTADGRIEENRDVLPRFFAVRNVIAGDDLRNHTDWKYTAVVRRVPDPALTQPWTTEDATVAIVRTATDRYRLRIRAPRTTLIVSSIVRYPGWRAGEFRTLDVNGPFLGFVVPAGEHEVEVAYRPLSFYVPAAIAVLTLLGLIVFARAPAPFRTPRASPLR